MMALSSARPASPLLTALLLTNALCCLHCQSSDAQQPPPEPIARAQVMPAEEATPVVEEEKVNVASAQKEEPAPTEVEEEPVDQDALLKTYPWLALTQDLPELTTLDRHIATPEGYTRQKIEDRMSYAAYLRGLPVRTDRENVLLYTGEKVWMPSAGVIPLDLGKRDVHQCADSVIRLHAEWLWSIDREDEAAYHYTSGDLAAWKDWKKGKVLKVKGNKVLQVSSTKSPDTHDAYRKWLDKVFTYASTRSLHRDSKKINSSSDLQSGDFYLQGGSPGHVVMILDIAEATDGSRVALFGQGYLPAREFHVIRDDDAIDGVWFELEDHTPVATPTWKPFGIEDAWRFE